MSVNHDGNREIRTGIPEVILAESKSVDDLLSAIGSALDQNIRVLITRIRPNQINEIESFVTSDYELIFDDFNRTAIIHREQWPISDNSVAIISAGTSDRPVVEEIAMCLDFFGIAYTINQDVGVAGIHRIHTVFDDIRNSNIIKVIIVVAGQDGALFSVVSGLSKLPVIAVPSSVGYGYGGKGEAALLSALQSCAPGIAVVNIDNGFGAAALASKIIRLLM